MTIGDVLAVVFFVIGLWISSWALVVGIALLFPARSAACQTLFAGRPWRALITGAILVATAGVVEFLLIRQPNGLGKMLGWAGLAALLGIAVLGASGLARLLGARLAGQPEAATGSTLARGAGLLVVSGLVPLLGWFAVVPLAIIASLGAGWLALWKRTEQAHPKPVAIRVETTAAAPETWEQNHNEPRPSQSTLQPQTVFPSQTIFVSNNGSSSELIGTEAPR